MKRPQANAAFFEEIPGPFFGGVRCLEIEAYWPLSDRDRIHAGFPGMGRAFVDVHRVVRLIVVPETKAHGCPMISFTQMNHGRNERASN